MRPTRLTPRCLRLAVDSAVECLAARIAEDWPWLYLLGAAIWEVSWLVDLAYVKPEYRHESVRYFFAFPVWPLGALLVTAIIIRDLWRVSRG